MDEQKPSWWKSLPGTLTAATGFVAALSGLVAGLNQLGVFRQHAPTPVATAPAPGDSARPASAPAVTGGASSSADSIGQRSPLPATQPARRPDRTAPPSRAPAPAAAPPAPATPAPTTRSPAAPLDSAPAPGNARLPRGTVLELAVPKRTCAPAEGGQRLTARVVGAVKVGGRTLLPANATAALRVRRGSGSPEVRLDSLAGPGVGGAVPSAQVRIVRGADGNGCLRADARLRATLGAAVPIENR